MYVFCNGKRKTIDFFLAMSGIAFLLMIGIALHILIVFNELMALEMWRNMHFISRVYLREINVPLYFTRMYNICDRVRSRVMLISNRSHRHPFSQPKKRDIYAGSDTYLIRVLIRHQITMQRISILSCGTYIFLLLREFGKTKSGCSSQPNSRSRVR